MAIVHLFETEDKTQQRKIGAESETATQDGRPEATESRSRPVSGRRTEADGNHVSR